MAEDVVTLAQPQAPSTSIPIPRLIGMIMSIAATIAISVGVYMWASAPSYTALYNGLEPKDATEVVAALQAAGIPYKLDGATGSVMVAAGRVHEARLKLAAQGLPKGTSMGIEMLQEEQSFGTSQFVESARYHHAMEVELARTISMMRNVKSARVHLAIPKKSVFVRKKDKPSASVALNLYGGRTIEEGQVNAIVHLVASSVADLSADNITVVDQNGRLLSSGGMSSNVAMSARQYDYTRQVEQDYARQIEHLLEPVMGVGKVRATVNAKIDFSQEESTEEVYNPKQKAIRSEQTTESAVYGDEKAEGVPGALSNQPPAGGTLVEGAGSVGAATTEEKAKPLNSSKNAIRNYELDRTIRHKKNNTGNIQRLTVAVLVDDHITTDEEGATERTPLSEEEITRITSLVQQTIGYDEQRGDVVKIINASFSPVEAEEALPEPSLLEQPWVMSIAKQVLAGVIILILIFTVLKPSVKSVTDYKPPVPVIAEGGEGAGGEGEAGGAEGEEGGMAQLEHQTGAGGIPLPSDHDEKVEFAKSMVEQDPKKVANVVKDWIGNEGS